MTRLPSLALIWLLALMAGVGSPTGFSVVAPAQAGIHKVEAAAVPSLFKPARVEHLLSAAPTRPSPSRYSFPHSDLCALHALGSLQAGRIERSPQLPVLSGPIAGLGAPRFPTGPPSA